VPGKREGRNKGETPVVKQKHVLGVDVKHEKGEEAGTYFKEEPNFLRRCGGKSRPEFQGPIRRERLDAAWEN